MAGLELPCLVKLRFALKDGGGERLRFEVAGTTDDEVDPTRINDPWNDIGIKCGDRGEHGLDRLTDWTLMSPADQITPRSTMPARRVREHKDKPLAIVPVTSVLHPRLDPFSRAAH